MTLSEKTPVTVGLVITAIGGVFWLSMVFAQGQENAKAIAEIKAEKAEYSKTVNDINQRLSRIEGAVGVKNGNTSN